MPYFTAPDGVRLHYENVGSGPPLILHLGAGADSGLWREAGYVEPLSRAYTCVLFDHRGHGLSDHPATVAANHIQRYADDVVALAEQLDHARVSFLGWSNAISIALKAAEDRPGLFQALVLIGAVGRPAAPDEIAAGTRQRLAEIAEKGWWSILTDMAAAEKLEVPQWFFDRVVATDLKPWMAFTEARPDWNWSLWDALPKIDVPALYLVGELEDPDDAVGEAAALMPNASRVRIPDRHHINAFLDSEFVVPRALEFLERHAPPGTS